MNLMNIFNGLQVYGGNWSVKSSRAFDAEEIAAVAKAEVVASEFGNSVCFFMKSGGMTYIPLSNTSTLTVGDSVDITKAELLTLHRDGSEDIQRVSV